MDSGFQLNREENGNHILCEICNEIGKINCKKCEDVWYCGRNHQRQHWNQHFLECRLYKVKNTTDAGNFLIASGNIRAGYKIITEDALVIGPMMTSSPICLACHCELSEDDYVKCPDCLWPMCSPKCYCSNQHDKECRVLCKDAKNCIAPQNFDHTPRYDLIVIIRCLLLKETNRRLWNVLMTMESHWEELKSSEDPFHTAAVSVLSKIYGFPMDVVHRIRGVIICNAIQVRGPGGGLLRAIYANINLFNHSCIPNINLSCNLKGQMECRAAIFIQKGEPLTICYSGTIIPIWERHSYLLKLHYFVCNCKRCSDATELGSYFSSPRCPKCRKCEYLTISRNSDIPGCWQCQKCDTQCSTEELMQEIDDWLFRMDMNELFGTGTVQRIVKALSNIELAFHRSHYLYLKASQEALVKLKKNNSFQALKLKKDIWTNILNIYDFLEPGLTLRRGMTFYEIGNITMHLASEDQNGELSPIQLENYKKEGYHLYKNALKILSLEPKDSPENNIVQILTNKLSQMDIC